MKFSLYLFFLVRCTGQNVLIERFFLQAMKRVWTERPDNQLLLESRLVTCGKWDIENVKRLRLRKSCCLFCDCAAELSPIISLADGRRSSFPIVANFSFSFFGKCGVSFDCWVSVVLVSVVALKVFGGIWSCISCEVLLDSFRQLACSLLLLEATSMVADDNIEIENDDRKTAGISPHSVIPTNASDSRYFDFFSLSSSDWIFSSSVCDSFGNSSLIYYLLWWIFSMHLREP